MAAAAGEVVRCRINIAEKAGEDRSSLSLSVMCTLHVSPGKGMYKSEISGLGINPSTPQTMVL